MKSIFDRDFKYVRSVDTDLRKTFARIQREQRSKKQAGSTRSIPDAARKIIALSVLKKGGRGFSA
jgi:hypothetical protein